MPLDDFTILVRLLRTLLVETRSVKPDWTIMALFKGIVYCVKLHPPSTLVSPDFATGPRRLILHVFLVADSPFPSWLMLLEHVRMV